MIKEQPHHRATLLPCRTKDTKKIPYHKSDAVKLLEHLVFEAKRKKYPTIPINHLAPVKYRDDKANALTTCIIDFIRLKGGQAERINTMGRPINRQSTFTDVTGRMRTIGRVEWIPGTCTKGSADVAATIAGRSVKIEVKVGRDKQSSAQVKYQEDVEVAGGLYYIARNFTDFKEWIDNLIPATQWKDG
jgi:hypothetical protein